MLINIYSELLLVGSVRLIPAIPLSARGFVRNVWKRNSGIRRFFRAFCASATGCVTNVWKRMHVGDEEIDFLGKRIQT